MNETNCCENKKLGIVERTRAIEDLIEIISGKVEFLERQVFGNNSSVDPVAVGDECLIGSLSGMELKLIRIENKLRRLVEEFN